MTSTPFKVALVADTHGYLDPRIAAEVALCDYAVHAGDIGDAGVLQAMRPRLGPVRAVLGNNDTVSRWPEGQASVLATLPQALALDLPGGTLIVVHGHRALPARERHARLRRRYPDAAAVVYGHSHRLVQDLDAVPWILNPGAAGRARTYGGPSCLLVSAAVQGWRVEPRRFAPPSAR